MRKLRAAVIVLITAGLAGCGYNDIQRNDEQVKSDWSEVLNDVPRRAQPLHKGRTGIQRAHTPVSGQPDRDAVQLPDEAELQRRGRKGHLQAADGRFRQARRAGEAVVPPCADAGSASSRPAFSSRASPPPAPRS